MAFIMALRRSGLRDTAILRAFESVPRKRFVPHRLADLAQEDIALPVACGQTMAAPSIQAEWIRVLDIPAQGRVLEIGTGSGYGTSLLARLSGEVISVERFRSLAIEARARLAGLGIANARVHHADGRHGYAASAPYDRILVEASFQEPPPALLGQLGPGGRLVGVRRTEAGSRLTRFGRGPHRELIVEEFGAFVLPPLAIGMAEAL